MLPIPLSCHACGSASHVRRTSLALYHLFLLAAIAFLSYRASTGQIPLHPRTDAPALSLCRGRLRGHAGTCAPAGNRTGGGNAIDGDASSEAAHGASVAAQQKRRDPRQRELFAEQTRRAFWQARFYDFNVRTMKKRIEKLRYMHRNPVKPGLVKSPEQWRWSSYRFYLLGEPGLVKVNEGWGKISFRKNIA